MVHGDRQIGHGPVQFVSIFEFDRNYSSVLKFGLQYSAPIVTLET
jgi:hypothetical protein